MKRRFSSLLIGACATLLAPASVVFAQGSPSAPMPSSAQLLSTPTSGLRINGRARPEVKNPYAGDKNALAAGKQLFTAMNCVGCHAPQGGGGMGPPLSDNVWIYGARPADIYLTLSHGRPKGMPAFGKALPPQSLWSLVAYVKTLSR